jgi:hypothetical protein
LTILSFHRLEFSHDVFNRIRDNKCCKEEKKCLSKSDSYHKAALKKEKTKICRQSIIRDLAKHTKNDHQKLIRSRRDESIEKSDRSSIEKFKSRRTKEDHFDQRRLNQNNDENFHVVAFAD